MTTILAKIPLSGLRCTAAALPLGLALLACVPTTDAYADARSSFLIDQLTNHNASLPATVRSEKYDLMRVSPRAFYRGTAHLYWTDLGGSPLLAPYGSDRTRIWLQGDAHTDNQGAFDDSSGSVVYDLNDFDEAVIGDYQLDLWRLATSVLLVARENGGFSAADEATITDALSDGYLDALSSYDGNRDELSQTITAATAYGLLDDFLSSTESKDSRKKLLDKYTTVSGGSRSFDLSNTDLEAVPAATAQALRDALPGYGATLSGSLRYTASYFQVKSVAKRLHAGLGSYGTLRYYLLIEGASTSNSDDRILDVKAEGVPVAYATLDAAAQAQTEAVSGGDAARRVSRAGRSLGSQVDEHLGELLALGQHFVVRERSPYKETFDTTQLTSKTRITKLAAQWGAALATAHARADEDADPVAIPYDFEHQVLSQIGTQKSQFKARVRSVASSYADRATADWKAVAAWLKSHP